MNISEGRRLLLCDDKRALLWTPDSDSDAISVTQTAGAASAPEPTNPHYISATACTSTPKRLLRQLPTILY
ncbi:uncharacterized protein YALI1_C06301g [Yarrowia lipolytica]|uniref:Uncharacterized protein n=1 Tax=Yarrowia lipolytica TaxID=4952 RepID=A0A1D8N9Q1_YARLL|nr:hypothetical protein YALI1_C06301g [Yarrowia lipolytica]